MTDLFTVEQIKSLFKNNGNLEISLLLISIVKYTYYKCITCYNKFVLFSFTKEYYIWQKWGLKG